MTILIIPIIIIIINIIIISNLRSEYLQPANRRFVLKNVVIWCAGKIDTTSQKIVVKTGYL